MGFIPCLRKWRGGGKGGKGDGFGGSDLVVCVRCCVLFCGVFFVVLSEKWHDQNAAQDVVWVNQTFWMESEMGLLDNVWETSEKASHFYNQQTKSSASQKER